MASVHKDPRGKSPFWYAAFRGPDGKRWKRSTGETTKSIALRKAETFEKAALEAKRRTLTEVRTREILSDILQTATGEGLTVFTVAEWFDHFGKQKKKSRADKTGKRYEQTLSQFIEFLGPKARLNIAAITSKDIAAVRDKREAEALSPATLNLDVTILSAAFNAAWKQGHISINPCAAIEPLRDNAERKHVFTPEQVTALVKIAKGEWKGLILTAFYTGQRLSDCVSLRHRDIDLVSEIRTIRFRPRKTGGEVVSVIHPALEDYLRSIKPKSGKIIKFPKGKDNEGAFVFPSLVEQTHPNASPLCKEFRKLMQRANIEQKTIRDKAKAGRCVYALSFHSLRHSFSSILANAGVSEERRMALTGHKTRDMHQHYSHHELAILRDAVSLLPRV
jgi:integrase